MPSTVRCVVGEICAEVERKDGRREQTEMERNTTATTSQKKGADPRWKKVGNGHPEQDGCRKCCKSSDLNLALVTPDGPPVKFNDPPLQPSPPPRRHPDSRQENMEPISYHLASGIWHHDS
jgi:hypothetical protein